HRDGCGSARRGPSRAARHAALAAVHRRQSAENIGRRRHDAGHDGRYRVDPADAFPVLREHREALALGYVPARIMECVLLLPAAIGPLMVVAIATSQADANPPDAAAYLDTVRMLTQTYDRWGQASQVFFCLSVLLLNYLLYRSRPVPRWIAGWA